MALQKKDGVYVVVENVEPTFITIREHADAEHRQRYKTQTESKFENTKQRGVIVETNLDSALEDKNDTILNNLKIKGYKSLKTLEEFKNYIDV